MPAKRSPASRSALQGRKRTRSASPEGTKPKPVRRQKIAKATGAPATRNRKRKVAANAAQAETPTPAPAAKIPKAGGTLDADLSLYADEYFTDNDVEAGRKLLVEVVGAIALGGAVLTALTSWLPAVGLTIGSGTVALIMMKLGEAYAELGAEERKAVRAVVTWIQGGFSLKDRLEK